MGKIAFCVIGNAGETKTWEFILQQILMITRKLSYRKDNRAMHPMS